MTPRTLAPLLAALVACADPMPPVAPAGAAPSPAAKAEASAPAVPAEPSCPPDGSPVPVSCTDPSWGAPDALVTIVEFSDFQCPFCGRVRPTLEALRAKYGPADLRIVWKDQPLSFHARALPTAIAARAVFAMGGSDAFWKFHDAVFQGQRDLSDDRLERWATAAGVPDLGRQQMGRARPEWRAQVAASAALGDRIGALGTPTFFVNGRAIVGAQPEAAFVAVIDEELARAKDRLARGAPRGQLYVAATTENFRPGATQDDAEEDAPEDTTTVWRVPVGTSPVLGAATAPVTIVLFSDFQCPYCKRAEETLRDLRQAYGKKLRIVWKNEPLPFHDRALPAATLAMEARQQRGDRAFWSVHDALFSSAPDLTDDAFARIAKGAGLDGKKAMTAVASFAHKAAIDADQALAREIDAVGTPQFFINGRRLMGAQPIDRFKTLIDEELIHADALLKKGTPAATLYDAMTKDGKASAKK